ncbi:MAG TPA: hypothetical protein VIH05_01805 [Tepidiformaceae bacterium]
MAKTRVRLAALVVAFATLVLVPTSVPDAAAGVQHRPGVAGGFASSLGIQPAIVSGKENTSAVVQNRSSATSMIAMDIYTTGGVLVSGAGILFTGVPPGGTRVFAQTANTGLATNFRGVGVVSSDQAFNALLVRDIKASNGQKSYSIVNAHGTGSSKISLPFIMNNFGGRSTRFTVANTGGSVACITVVYSFLTGEAPVTASGPGGSGCSGGQFPIPANGQVSFARDNVDGAIPMPSTTAGKLMAVMITAVNSPVTASVDAFGGSAARRLASYDGFEVGASSSTTDDVSTSIAIPVSLKTREGWYSQILLSNPNSSTASATVTYRGTVDGYPTSPVSVPVTVPANGVVSQSVYHVTNLPVGFVGTAAISSTQPLAVVLFRMKMTSAGSMVEEHQYTAANGVPIEQAATRVRLPLVFRHALKPSGSTKLGYNSWFSVMTANGGTANITIQAVNDPTSVCAGTYSSTVNTQVTGSRIFYQLLSSPVDNGFKDNPACFWGGVTITSDKPIIVVANVGNDLVENSDNDGLYNGFAE